MKAFWVILAAAFAILCFGSVVAGVSPGGDIVDLVAAGVLALAAVGSWRQAVSRRGSRTKPPPTPDWGHRHHPQH